MNAISYRVRMEVTSVDLQEMADKAREIETKAAIGQSVVIKDWQCDSSVIVHIVVDQDRAKLKGLME